MSEASAGDERMIVPITVSDILIIVTQLTVTSVSLSTAILLLSQGDNANASRVALEASQKLDPILDDLMDRLQRAKPSDAG